MGSVEGRRERLVFFLGRHTRPRPFVARSSFVRNHVVAVSTAVSRGLLKTDVSETVRQEGRDAVPRGFVSTGKRVFMVASPPSRRRKGGESEDASRYCCTKERADSDREARLQRLNTEKFTSEYASGFAIRLAGAIPTPALLKQVEAYRVRTSKY